MVKKAKVVLMTTEQRDEWFVYRVDYLTEAETEYDHFGFSNRAELKEGDVLKLVNKAELSADVPG